MAELDPSADAALSDVERLDRRAQIGALEAHLKGLPADAQIPIDGMTSHVFASGVYCRRADIPAGVVAIGKIHKTEHLAILLSGSVRITTEAGTVDLTAPQVMVSPPGTKRIALALTDTTWLAIHAVGEERDLEKIESSFIAEGFDELEASPDDLQIARTR